MGLKVSSGIAQLLPFNRDSNLGCSLIAWNTWTGVASPRRVHSNNTWIMIILLIESILQIVHSLHRNIKLNINNFLSFFLFANWECFNLNNSTTKTANKTTKISFLILYNDLDWLVHTLNMYHKRNANFFSISFVLSRTSNSFHFFFFFCWIIYYCVCNFIADGKKKYTFRTQTINTNHYFHSEFLKSLSVQEKTRIILTMTSKSN